MFVELSASDPGAGSAARRLRRAGVSGGRVGRACRASRLMWPAVQVAEGVVTLKALPGAAWPWMVEVERDEYGMS